MLRLYITALRWGCVQSALAFLGGASRAARQQREGALEHEGPALFGEWGFDLHGRNLSVLPGHDFNEYANGVYLADMTIPADQSSWGNFQILGESTSSDIKDLLEVDDGIAGEFYKAYMDETLAETLDLAPLQPALDSVRNIRNPTDFAAVVGRANYGFLPSPIGVGIGPDSTDPQHYCVYIGQGGLGLPDRDYYLDAKFKSKLDAYVTHVEHVLTLISWPEPKEMSTRIEALEHMFANVTWAKAAMRDPKKTYNPTNATALSASAPGLDWATFFSHAAPFPANTKMVVNAPSGVAGIARIVGETNLTVLKAWAAFHLVAGAAPKLSSRFVNETFAFSKILSGVKKLQPRWKRAVGATNGFVGDAVGALYVKEHFPPESKAQVELLTAQIKDAFKRRMSQVDWMTNATKTKALAKLDAMRIKIGYGQFRSYDGLVINKTDSIGNSERAIAFSWLRDLKKLPGKVDPESWDGLLPQEINAYARPLFNEVVFPAAILQPPFFDPHADHAVNLGAIGAVIGHEMTHGFDDSGRQYDAEGKLSDWWTEKDATEFKNRATLYGKQFGDFDLGIPGAKINGELTLGEDIADLGGLTLALDAYTHAQERSDIIPPMVDLHNDGLEGYRRLFLGFAQMWRGKTRPDALKSQLVSDPHPPCVARVDIPVRNLAIWYEAFGVTDEQKLFLAGGERVTIW